jgi:hypothetical protein
MAGGRNRLPCRYLGSLRHAAMKRTIDDSRGQQGDGAETVELAVASVTGSVAAFPRVT